MTIYLNGEHRAKDEAGLAVEDRGALFADGVYEVVRYYQGRAFELERHIDRLKRSLAGIRLPEPVEVDALGRISDELVRQNDTPEAKVYWQITRGPAPREHAFPAQPRPSVLVMPCPAEPIDQEVGPAALRAVLHPDRRWADCWIKSLMLLPNVLAKQAALDAGADEAILYFGDRVTEGSATSVFLVKDGALWTHPANGVILGSITRQLLLELAEARAMPVRCEPCSLDMLGAADEVMICGTTTHVSAITHVNDRPVIDGRIGPVTRSLHAALMQRIASQCGHPALTPPPPPV